MSNKKILPKVLMIGTTDNVGGAARVGWDIGKGLQQKGYSVKYIVGYKKMDSPYVYELKKSRITEWLGKKTHFNVTSYLRHLRGFLLADDIDFGASEEIFNHPWYKEADIIHLHNLHGGFFKLENLIRICREKKVVWTLHDLWPITAHCAFCYDCKNWNNGKHHNTDYKKYGAMLWDNSSYLWNKKKNIYKQCQFHLIPSSSWLNNYVKKSILKQFPSTVMLNSIDTETFKPGNKNKIRKELKLPIDKKIVAYVNQGGKVDPRKGGGYLLKVAEYYAQDSSILFLCIGGGKIVKQEGNILYIPFVLKAADLVKYYQSADLFLFTSLADNCPLVVLEALSTGLPIVSFDVGGVKEEILHKKNGYIAKYKDLNDLIKGVDHILKMSKKDYQHLSLNNSNRAKNEFSLSVIADKVSSIYKQL